MNDLISSKDFSEYEDDIHIDKPAHETSAAAFNGWTFSEVNVERKQSRRWEVLFCQTKAKKFHHQWDQLKL